MDYDMWNIKFALAFASSRFVWYFILTIHQLLFYLLLCNFYTLIFFYQPLYFLAFSYFINFPN